MDAILNPLGGLLLRALPTFLLVLVLHFYLKRVFFAPLDKVLEARRQATEGARERGPHEPGDSVPQGLGVRGRHSSGARRDV